MIDQFWIRASAGILATGKENSNMAATTSGTKTVTKDLGPSYTAAQLTTILATPIENLTIAQFRLLEEALRKVPKGHDPSLVIGTLFV
jgi:hypothetical protein